MAVVVTLVDDGVRRTLRRKMQGPGQDAIAAVKACSQDVLRELQRTRGFVDDSGDLRRSFRLGGTYQERKGTWTQATVYAGGPGFGAQAIAVEYGVADHGTYGTVDVFPLGRRGDYNYMARALLAANSSADFLRNVLHSRLSKWHLRKVG